MKNFNLKSLGIFNTAAIYRNLTPAELIEEALITEDCALSETGALVVTTGKYTGRSPEDKFIVDTPKVHKEISWGKVNRPISLEKYNAIRAKMVAYLQNRELFVVKKPEEDDESEWTEIRAVLDEALAGFAEMRRKEGENLFDKGRNQPNKQLEI